MKFAGSQEQVSAGASASASLSSALGGMLGAKVNEHVATIK